MMSGKKTRSDIDRFMSFVRKDDSGCWVWRGALTVEGYGRFFFNGRSTTAQRAAYSIFHGPVDDGLSVDHLCRNRACVNPDHLEAVTQAENVRRGVAARDTGACPHGHGLEFRVKRAGRRLCTECDRLRAIKYYAARNTRAARRRSRRWLTASEKASEKALIAELIAAGKSNRQIAAEVSTSTATVSRWRNRAA